MFLAGNKHVCISAVFWTTWLRMTTMKKYASVVSVNNNDNNMLQTEQTCFWSIHILFSLQERRRNIRDIPASSDQSWSVINQCCCFSSWSWVKQPTWLLELKIRRTDDVNKTKTHRKSLHYISETTLCCRS